MEVAGLAVGILALVGVFEDCVTLLSQIGAAKSIEKDYTLLATRLDIQKALLLNWAERLKLYDATGYDRRLVDPILGPRIYQGLDCIHQLLQDGHVLKRQYGVRQVHGGDLIETSTTSVSSRLMTELRQKSLCIRSRKDTSVHPSEKHEIPHQFSSENRNNERPHCESELLHSNKPRVFDQPVDETPQNKRLRHTSRSSQCEIPHQLSDSNRTRYSAILNKVKWVIKDKDQFESLVRKLSELVSDMDKLVPPQEGDIPGYNALESEIRRLKNVCELRMIIRSCADGVNNLSGVTRQIIDRECTCLVLNRLWFRLIDDRRDSISQAHSNTLEWAIDPPTSGAVWDDLDQWLRSGYGIYWIYGKPGSGKSTLMKFLHGHPKVMSSLQKWAGTTKVTVASFYLWNVGSVEQSSQKGLAQGLLYHVLEQNPALIPAVLPHMWKEAQSGTVDLKPPTDIELKTAFKQLGAETTNGAFAFFIDGLDEFTGNHVDGIEFVKSLAASTNIKVLVSSRPIDTCVAKLSSAPKLRLQDLTKPDIEKYVNDVIRTHPSVAKHSYLSDTSIEGLVSDMQSKADGVFLWVVLGCRTLLEGFGAYDSAEELRSRVDELPAELESLFRHILNGLPPHFLQQAAKLLRVCYVDRCLRPSGTLAAIPLAWAHEKDMHIDALEQFPHFSDDETGRKFIILEGRLRSRCRGLLETHTVHDDYGGNGYSYWTVGFMHRTVFEFLNTPDIWQMDCLRIDDDHFDVTTVLSYMSCYELWLQDSFASASTTLWHISQVEQKSPTNLSRTLNRLAFAVMQSKDGCRNFFLVSQHNLSVDDLSLLLALEFDLPTFVQNYDVRGFNTRHKLGINLLQHTFEKHVLYVELKYENYLPISAVSVAHLIASGCDPTESIALSEQDTTTPWEIWMETEHTNVKETGDLENAEITMMMIRAGALCAHAGLTHTKDYRARLIQQSGEWQKDLSRMKTVQDQEKMKQVCNEIMQAVEASYRSDSE